MKISVVIPTYRRADILKLTLEALTRQTLSKDRYEVIVVDDGSDDGGETRKVVEESGYTYIWQENQKQGIARNNGIKHTNHEIILLIGDDMIPSHAGFLEEHLKLHEEHPEERFGVLGFVDWHPDINANYFMKWLTHGSCILGKYGGHQFAYEKLGGGPDGKDAFGKKINKAHSKSADHNFFYTANISIKRSLLKKEPFDKEFSMYGWEDIELGYRLEQKYDFQLLYNPNAVVWHHHVITEDSLAPRMRMIAKSAQVIHKKYPELAKIPSEKKVRIFKILSNSVVLHSLKMLSKIQPSLRNYYYYGLSKKYYLEGLKENL